jgi:hypothetical protein
MLRSKKVDTPRWVNQVKQTNVTTCLAESKRLVNKMPQSAAIFEKIGVFMPTDVSVLGGPTAQSRRWLAWQKQLKTL